MRNLSSKLHKGLRLEFVFTTIIAIAALGLSGCVSDSYPEGVVHSAYQKLQSNNHKKFSKLLTGSAKEKYGSKQGMKNLRELVGKKKPEISASVLLTTESLGNGYYFHTYQVPVTTKQGHRMDCQVHCHMQVRKSECYYQKMSFFKVYGFIPGEGRKYGHPSDWGHGFTYYNQESPFLITEQCFYADPNDDTDTESRCRIDSIDF